MLDEMIAACRAAGTEARGANLREIADDVLAHPATQESFVCEGAIFDLAGGDHLVGSSVTYADLSLVASRGATNNSYKGEVRLGAAYITREKDRYRD
jgi:hypothetical protein